VGHDLFFIIIFNQISPTELTKKGVSVSRCVQKPREFVVIFPQCYSANVCCGNMIAESVCYALPDWLSAGLASSVSITYGKTYGRRLWCLTFGLGLSKYSVI
jgi:hypothetical protein